MAPNKRQSSTKKVGSSSKAPPQPQKASRTTRAIGNIPHPLSLTHLDHVGRYNCLDKYMVVATRCYDEDFLARLKMLDDTRWLFAKSGIRYILELKEHTYRDLTLEFLRTLHVEVTRGPHCQAGYISFYLQGQL